ncbi:unnamed protein product [Rotaria sp. Silwood2]|nr:unnamed protein product [Rotaria sp. Silwood2]
MAQSLMCQCSLHNRYTHSTFLYCSWSFSLHCFIELLNPPINPRAFPDCQTTLELILLRKFGGRLDAEILTQFVDAGGNVLVAGSDTVGDVIREFASECGIEFADDKSSVIDHINFDINDDGQHTLIVASPNNLLSSELIVGQTKKNGLPFLFRGTG